MLLRIVRRINAGLRAITRASHWAQFQLERALEPRRRWFDHHVDVHWGWKRGRFHFTERGVFNALVIRDGAQVLDLCCGDGFYTSRYYAWRSRRVVGVDLDVAVLRHARAHNGAANVEYVEGDITATLPAGPFDNVIWDASAQYFSDDEFRTVVSLAAGVMAPGAVMSGWSEGLSPRGPGELERLLESRFAHVALLKLDDPTRAGIHFFAANDETALPSFQRQRRS